MCKIMLLEDDLSLIDGLSFALGKQGWDVDVSRTISEAKDHWQNGKFDLLILDVSLPDGSGFDFCRYIRRESDVPVLFLTAADEETDIVMGLDIGGDDYVTKPFKLGILLSRIHALLRRSKNASSDSNVLSSGAIKVVVSEGQAYKDGNPLDLTGVEYRMLCYFLQNRNRVLTKEQIYDRLWGCDGNYVDDNTLSVYIRRLRLKVEDDPEHPEQLVTIRGLGYKWKTL